MKDFLPILFYQAIVAVNTAVIINGIIWLAKRKEKQEKKPNPDFTPPQTKKPPTPPTTGTCAVKPKDGVSADEAAKLFSKLSQAAAGLGGNSKLDELEEKLKDLADTLDRIDKKPVTQERVKEMGFETEPVTVFNRKEERWETRPVKDFKKWYVPQPTQTTRICRNCKHFLTTDEEATVGECGLNDEIMFKDETRACFEPKQKKAKPSCADCRWFVKWRDGDTTCANTGLPVYDGLIGAHCEYYERKPGKSIVRPKPIGTKTTH